MRFESWLEFDGNGRGGSNSVVLEVEVDGSKFDQSVLY